MADTDLVAVEAAVQEALASGREDHLRVLGHGEISLVVGWPSDAPAVACKRLPVFPSRVAADRYADVFSRYVARLEQRGLHVVPSHVHFLEGGDGRLVGYVVQPVLPAASLGPDILRAATPDPDHPLLGAVVAGVLGAVDPRTGLDAQISNWSMVGATAQYLDVTTPILYDESGRLELDVDLLVASYPWVLRPPLRRFAAPPIAAAYCDPRTVLLDLAANLHKERLTGWIPAVLEAANLVLGEPLTAGEVDRYYRSNARLWEVMLRLRQADRWWQRRVRRRSYPFLLPGPTSR